MPESLSALLLLCCVVGVFVITVRPPSSAALRRRRRLVDGRTFDRDPVAAVPWGGLLLLGLGAVDAAELGDGLSGGSAFVMGAALATVTLVRPLEGVVYTAVGGLALFHTMLELLTGAGCGVLTNSGRVTCVLVACIFLAVLGGTRLLVAPLRPLRGQARGAFLVVFGVLELTQQMLALAAAGGFADFSPRDYLLGGLGLVVLAAGTAVEPMFATSVLGIGITLLALTTAAAAACLPGVPLVALLAGVGVTRGVLARARRPRSERR